MKYHETTDFSSKGRKFTSWDRNEEDDEKACRGSGRPSTPKMNKNLWYEYIWIEIYMYV